MKIVLIAGYSNAEIRNFLHFRKNNKLYESLIRLFHLPARSYRFADTTPWVKNIVTYFEKLDNVELHVVCPHIRLKKSIEEFTMRGVYYHYYRTEFTSFLRLINKYCLWRLIQNSSYYVRKIVDPICPDIVVLSGAENPATSESVLALKNYPCICLCQTIYNSPQRSQLGKMNQLISNMEKNIFSKLDYFGVYCSLHYHLLRSFRADATIFRFGYPSMSALLEPTSLEKVYDFVNFAQLHGSGKGTPDSILALSILKKHYPNVTLNIVGGCDGDNLKKHKELVTRLDLQDNVIFTPFFEKRSDLFLHIQKSRFAVLPCKLDNISGTMNQAMQLGLPLIVYKTTGTPKFNRVKECALIAEMENVEELASCMFKLMDNPDIADSLRKNALVYQKMRLVERANDGDRLYKTFDAVIQHYRNRVNIPTELLFDPDRDD